MGTYLVTWKWVWLNQECRNTFYYTTDVGEPSDSEWQDIVDEIRADVLAEWVPVMPTNAKFYGIDRRRVDTAGLLTFIEVPTLGDAVGTSGSDSLPTQVAMLVGNKGTTTKPNRARTYLPCATDAAVVDGLITSALRTRAEDLIDLQSNLNVGGTNPLSRVAAQWNTNHTVVTATNDLSGAASVLSEVPATQRRRRIGVGI